MDKKIRLAEALKRRMAEYVVPAGIEVPVPY